MQLQPRLCENHADVAIRTRPRLKSAHIFGAITGVINEHAPSTGSNGSEGDNNSLSGVQQTRYTTSLQEMYRSTLTSQWNLTGEELNPEDCIEDIFRGGNGWKTGTTSAKFKDSRRVKDAEQKSISSSDPEAESLTLQVPKIRPPTQASTPTPHDMSSVPIILNRQPSASSLSNASGLSIPSSTRSTKSDRSLQLPTARSSRSNSSATSDRERRRRAHLEDMPGHGYGSMLAPRGNGGSHGFWMGERTAEVSRMKTGRSITRERVNGRCGELEESELTGGDLRSWFHQSWGWMVGFHAFGPARLRTWTWQGISAPRFKITEQDRNSAYRLGCRICESLHELRVHSHLASHHLFFCYILT